MHPGLLNRANTRRRCVFFALGLLCLKVASGGTCTARFGAFPLLLRFVLRHGCILRLLFSPVYLIVSMPLSAAVGFCYSLPFRLA